MKFPPRPQSRCSCFLLLFLAVPFGHAETVSALGRALPESRVIDLFAEPEQVVTHVFVQEGDWVEPGQVLARLSSHAHLEAEEQKARANLQATRKAQSIKDARFQTKIEGLVKEVEIARTQFQRVSTSDAAQFAAPDLLDQKQLILIQTETALAVAREEQNLQAVEAGQSIREAQSLLREALNALQRSEIRAPIRAKVLKQLAFPGFPTNRGELFKLGNTESMVIIAEVYESDIRKLSPGNSARITSSALPNPLQGEVVHIGSMIFKDSVDSLDPTALTNARVVEVIILLDKPAALEDLVYLQVDVEIQI